MDIHVKTWVESKGNVVFGEGRRQLLEWVDSTGSLNQAAKEMKMSYRAAWGKIRDTEKRLGYKLLETTTGGPSGGGSKLTQKGRALVDAYAEFGKKMRTTADATFEQMIAPFMPAKKKP
jgi:molybdate transport system regulatory protein